MEKALEEAIKVVAEQVKESMNDVEVKVLSEAAFNLSRALRIVKSLH